MRCPPISNPRNYRPNIEPRTAGPTNHRTSPVILEAVVFIIQTYVFAIVITLYSAEENCQGAETTQST
jgi:hypothetical protein